MSGLSNGEGDRSREIPGVLGPDTERTQDSLRRSDPSSAVSEAEGESQEAMQDTVS